jgi:hypothetical protein
VPIDGVQNGHGVALAISRQRERQRFGENAMVAEPSKATSPLMANPISSSPRTSPQHP